MVLGSLQCMGVLLLWVIVGQGPAVRKGGCFYCSVFLSYLSYLPFIMPHLLGDDLTAILWTRLLDPNGSCQLLPGACSLSTGQPLSRPKLAQEQCQ